MIEKAKGPTLSEQLQAIAGKAKAPEFDDGGSAYPIAPSRRSKKAVTIWVDPLVADQSKEIAFHHRKSQQALFREALNILFANTANPKSRERRKLMTGQPDIEAFVAAFKAEIVKNNDLDKSAAKKAASQGGLRSAFFCLWRMTKGKAKKSESPWLGAHAVCAACAPSAAPSKMRRIVRALTPNASAICLCLRHDYAVCSCSS